MREDTRLIFDLTNHKKQLSNALANIKLHPKIRTVTQNILEASRLEVTVHHPHNWGIETPGYPGHVIFDWVEMAAAYLFQAQNLFGSYEDYWVKKDKKVILTFGFDNAFYYTGLVPALLWAYDKEIRYPDAFVSNFFLNLNGKKKYELVLLYAVCLRYKKKTH